MTCDLTFSFHHNSAQIDRHILNLLDSVPVISVHNNNTISKNIVSPHIVASDPDFHTHESCGLIFIQRGSPHKHCKVYTLLGLFIFLLRGVQLRYVRMIFDYKLVPRQEIQTGYHSYPQSERLCV